MARKRWIQCRETGKLIPADEWYRREEIDAPMVMGDIQPYRSVVDGSVIASRSAHRAHLRQHGLTEVGNEKIEHKPRQPRYNSDEVKRELWKAIDAHGGKVRV